MPPTPTLKAGVTRFADVINQDPTGYQSLDPGEKFKVAQDFFAHKVATQPGYSDLQQPDRDQVWKDFRSHYNIQTPGAHPYLDAIGSAAENYIHAVPGGNLLDQPILNTISSVRQATGQHALPSSITSMDQLTHANQHPITSAAGAIGGGLASFTTAAGLTAPKVAAAGLPFLYHAPTVLTGRESPVQAGAQLPIDIGANLAGLKMFGGGSALGRIANAGFQGVVQGGAAGGASLLNNITSGQPLNVPEAWQRAQHAGAIGAGMGLAMGGGHPAELQGHAEQSGILPAEQLQMAQAQAAQQEALNQRQVAEQVQKLLSLKATHKNETLAQEIKNFTDMARGRHELFQDFSVSDAEKKQAMAMGTRTLDEYHQELHAQKQQQEQANQLVKENERQAKEAQKQQEAQRKEAEKSSIALSGSLHEVLTKAANPVNDISRQQQFGTQELYTPKKGEGAPVKPVEPPQAQVVKDAQGNIIEIKGNIDYQEPVSPAAKLSPEAKNAPVEAAAQKVGKALKGPQSEWIHPEQSQKPGKYQPIEAYKDDPKFKAAVQKLSKAEKDNLNTLVKAAKEDKKVLTQQMTPVGGVRRSQFTQDAYTPLGIRFTVPKSGPRQGQPSILVDGYNENAQFSTRHLSEFQGGVQLVNDRGYQGLYHNAYRAAGAFAPENAIAEHVMNPINKRVYLNERVEDIDYQNAAENFQQIRVSMPAGPESDAVITKGLQKLPQKVIDKLGESVGCGKHG